MTATATESKLTTIRTRALALIEELSAAAGDEKRVIKALRPHFDQDHDFNDLVLSALIVTFSECVAPSTDDPSSTDPTF